MDTTKTLAALLPLAACGSDVPPTLEGTMLPALTSDIHTILYVALGGPDMAPGELTAGTYVVPAANEPYGLHPLTVAATLSTPELETSGVATSGSLQVSAGAMRTGAESTGELDLQFAAPAKQGSLAGNFTATYCADL
jgi:hypothetical protein